MTDVLNAIAACHDLVDYWDVGKRPEGGVLVRATSKHRYTSEDLAASAARLMVARLGPDGHQAEVVTAIGRLAGSNGDGWHAFVELVVA
jgi:hypothetical protein